MIPTVPSHGRSGGNFRRLGGIRRAEKKDCAKRECEKKPFLPKSVHWIPPGCWRIIQPRLSVGAIKSVWYRIRNLRRLDPCESSEKLSQLLRRRFYFLDADILRMEPQSSPRVPVAARQLPRRSRDQCQTSTQLR